MRWLGPSFPWGTLAVNLIGCFLIGTVATYALVRTDFSETMRLVINTGFMGGLTTYSAFNYETTKYLQDGQAGKGAAYLAATLLGCFALGLAGVALGRTLGTR